MRNDLIRVTLQGDDAAAARPSERSGMVRDRRLRAEVLVWQLPQDADGLPAELRDVLSDPDGPAVLGLDRQPPSRWFDEALALGVDDVVCLPQPPESLGMAAAAARAQRSRRRGAGFAAGACRAAHARSARLHRVLHQGRLGQDGDRDKPRRVCSPARASARF